MSGQLLYTIELIMITSCTSSWLDALWSFEIQSKLACYLLQTGLNLGQTQVFEWAAKLISISNLNTATRVYLILWLLVIIIIIIIVYLERLINLHSREIFLSVYIIKLLKN